MAEIEYIGKWANIPLKFQNWIGFELFLGKEARIKAKKENGTFIYKISTIDKV